MERVSDHDDVEICEREREGEGEREGVGENDGRKN